MADSAVPTSQAEVELDFDHLTENPYPTYHRLRTTHPWAWSPQLRSWVVTRYDDVAWVDRDAETFSSLLDDDPATRARGRAMTRTDGSEHLRLRTAAGRPLKRRNVAAEWAEIVAGHAAGHVARMADQPAFDVLADFATPLMADILLEVLGFEGADANDVRRWSAAFVAGVAEHADDPVVWAAVRAARDEVQGHVVAAAERLRTSPDRSVVSAMLEASVGEPDIEEIGSNVRLMLSGGYNEPRDMVATLSWLLLVHPAERAVALASSEGLERAIDEAVRWLTPLGATPRQATRDVAVAGVRVRAGDRVLAVLAAGNHDPERFAEPETFNPARGNLADHMGFGLGTHFCLGTYLARQVMRTAVPRLLAIPDLDVDREVPFRGWRFRAPLTVPVRRRGTVEPAPLTVVAGAMDRPSGDGIRPEAQPVPCEDQSMLCAVADIPDGELLRVERQGHPAVAVAMVDGDVFCIDDRCTHEDTALSEGWLDGTCVECPLHDSRFDLRDGRPDAPPARTPVRTYPVAVVDGLVYLQGSAS